MSAHGTDSRYVNDGCRCADCRAAHAKWHRERRDVRHGMMLRGEVSPTHGTASTYVNYRCRCEECSAAARRRDAVGAAG